MVLHADLFDWSDKSLTPDGITLSIVGDTDYWEEDEDFEGLKPLEIERQILFEAGRDNLYQTSPYGKPYYKHFLTLMVLMFPETDVTPSLADAVHVFCLSQGHRKLLNLIGCQSSSKSASVARIMFVCMYIDPERTSGFVATVFDSASDSGAWGDAISLWEELAEAHPIPGNPTTSSLFPKGQKYAVKKLVFLPGIAKAGTIELRNVKHAGKFKGNKTANKATDRGWFLMNLDEVNEMEGAAVSFLDVVENLASQKAFFGFSTQNFKDTTDLGGAVTQPVPAFGGPTSFEDLDAERDQFWYSAKSSVTLRFDGHKSPNILAKRVIYPYLIDEKDVARLKESGGGEDSLIYQSQVRSFPIRGMETNSVLSLAKISSSRHKDVNYQMLHTKGSVAFCDPAFSVRGDAAVWGCAHFGDATVLDGDGQPQHTELLVFNDYMKKLKIVNDAYYNEYWYERMRDCGLTTSDFPEGSEVSIEEQVAIQCRELNLANGVPAKNFGFDFSMRPDIISAMNKIVGFDALALAYNQKPHGYFLENTKQQTEDVCKNLITEMTMMAADVLLTKQLRGGGLIDTALVQMNRTYVEMVNSKYVTEDKLTYKSRWQGKSPDERDTFVGIVKMALDRGFRQGTAQSATSDVSAWNQIMRSGAGKARVTAVI